MGGAIAVDSLLASPCRTSSTVAALTCSLALGVSLAGAAEAAYSIISDCMQNVLYPKLYVTPWQRLVVTTCEFPESMEAELADLPGVGEVHAVHTAAAQYRGPRTTIAALSVSVTDRRRELCVLLAVGWLRHQVRAAIGTKAMATGAIGVALGLALGAVYLYFFIAASALDAVRLGYVCPFAIARLLLQSILAVSFLAVLGPGELVVRRSLVEGLAYEERGLVRNRHFSHAEEDDESRQQHRQ